MKQFFSAISVIMFTISTHAQMQIGQDIDGESADDNSGCSVSMPDSYTVAIGAIGNDGNGESAGHVRVYTWKESTWIQKGIDIDGELMGDCSGYSVSMPDSNTVAIGAVYNDGNGDGSGHVRVYTWNGSAWVQKGADIDGEANFNLSGNSVSMPDSNTLAIGAIYNSDNGSFSGQVRVFSWNGSNWIQKGADLDGESSDNYFGKSVSMPDSNTLAVGAPNNSGNGYYSGQVLIYKWQNGSWVQKGNGIYGLNEEDQAGVSVSMSDSNTVAIGTKDYAIIFVWEEIDWVQKGEVISCSTNLNSSFPVSMPDSVTVAIHFNAYDHPNFVQIYQWNNSSWEQKGVDITGEAEEDYAGNSISMPNSNIIAVGAPYNDGNGDDAGHVRIYSLCITTGTDVITACNSYTWIDGNTYTESNNTATYTLPNAAGCDSIVTLNLTINHSTSGTDVITACDSYTWIDGITYTESNNTATYTLTNAAGCDSIVTLNLTIYTVDISVTNTSPTLTANAVGATYQWLDCNDNMAVITGETNQSFTTATNGSYAVEVTQNGCTDTSVCEIVNNVSILDNDFGNTLVFYPNPTDGIFSIDLATVYTDITVIIRNNSGQEINRQTFGSTKKLQFNIEGETGIYLVEINADNKRAMLKVIKE